MRIAKNRKAVKDHRCDKCKGSITAGQTYAAVSSFTDDPPFRPSKPYRTQKFHQDCVPEDVRFSRFKPLSARCSAAKRKGEECPKQPGGSLPIPDDAKVCRRCEGPARDNVPGEYPDAPEGMAWQCPDCKSWATLGGNARFHVATKRHGVPTLVRMPAEDDGWTDEWPTEPGDYWFYGWPFGRDKDFSGNPVAPQMDHVAARLSANKQIMLVREGHFFYKEEGAVGKFRKADLPKPPKLEE